MRTTAPAEKKNYQEILNALGSHQRERGALSGMGQVSWKDEKRSVAANAVLLAEWPDKLRLEIQDPIGGVQALLLVDGSRFWWFSREDKNAWTGPDARLGEFFGFPVSGRDLVALFLVRPSLEGFRWSSEYEGEGELKKSHPFPERLVWSSRLQEPVQWLRQYSNGAEIRVGFENYAARFGVETAEEITLEFVQGKLHRFFTFTWKDWQPHVSKDRNFFKIPPEQSFGRETKSL